jgi:hypothetical protein
MSQTTSRLFQGKPIIKIAVTTAVPIPDAVTPILEPRNFQIQEYRALIDTGATITCLCQNVVKQERLKSYGMTQMFGANGPSIHLTYLVNIGVWCSELVDFEGNGEISRSLYQIPETIEAPIINPNQWFDVIIGTDILKNCEFHLKMGGEFTLSLG